MTRTSTLLRLKLLFGSLLILVAAQAFIGGLSLTSLEKLYTRSLVSSFESLGTDFLLKLEAAVRFGKSLDNFFGIDKAMQGVRQNLPELSNIMVALPDGTVVQSMEPHDKGLNLAARIEFDTAASPKPDSAGNERTVVRTKGERHLVFRLNDKKGELAGHVVFSFPENLIQQRVKQVLLENIKALVLVTSCAALLLLLGLRFFVGLEGGLQKKRLYVVLLLAVGGAQLAYAFYNINMFRERYVEMTTSKAEKLTSLVREDIEFLLNKGLKVTRLVKIEDRFMEIIRLTPEVDYIEILTPDNHVLNRATRQGARPTKELREQALMMDGDPEGLYDISLPLIRTTDTKQTQKAGAIHVRLDKEVIQAKVREILLDSLTVTLISLLFVVELLLFFMLSLRRALNAGMAGVSPPRNSPALNREQALQETARQNEAEFAYMLGRPAAFAFVFMWALPASFIPLYMQTLYQPMFGLSKDVILGLPISLEMLCALVAALISGMVTDHKGWHWPFLLGAVICAAGALLSASANDGMAFILSRGVTGLGYGLSWMAIQGYIFQFSTPTTRARGIANLVAGIVSGQICGTAVGAMLAERLGYPPVFVGGALLAVLPLAFALLFMRPYMHRGEVVPNKQKLHLKDVTSLLFNRNYFAILFFSLIPFALCQVGLLFYAAPIYLNELGISQSNIGRVLMIYGLSVIYVAPWISRFVDHSHHKKRFIILGGVVGAVGLMSLYFYSGFLAVMFAVFLMGLSGSLVGSSQSAFALKLSVIQKVGVGKAMSVQRAADKLGQMLGPLVLGAMIASVGIGNGVAIVGLIFFIATLIFLLITSEDASPQA